MEDQLEKVRILPASHASTVGAYASPHSVRQVETLMRLIVRAVLDGRASTQNVLAVLSAKPHAFLPFAPDRVFARWAETAEVLREQGYSVEFLCTPPDRSGISNAVIEVSWSKPPASEQ
jgi:hypothetical protein